MADAGRILHHLKHNLWRPESTILFVGYQAEGSLGRRLVEGMKRVRVMGEEIAVRAKIMMLDGFSAHADERQIVDWLGHFNKPRPAKVFIVHGETPAQEAIKSEIQKELALEAYIPFRGDAAEIEGRACKMELSTIPSVSVEKDMEEILKNFDADYRAVRKKLLQLVIKRPELMEPIIRTLEKGWKYLKRLFAAYNI